MGKGKRKREERGKKRKRKKRTDNKPEWSERKVGKAGGGSHSLSG